MARTVEQILEATLGQLVAQVALLTAQNEALTEQNQKLQPNKPKETK